MNRGVYMLANAFFQFDEAVWGTLRSAEECCPGVYYLATDSGSQFYVNEFYAVPKDYSGDIISKETLAYGTESNGFLLFELGAEGSGAKLVDYEIQRYKVKMGMALNATESLYCTALYAMTQYPEYFGGVLPPRYTPCGLTVRVKTVSNGIYFVETDQCKWLLALNYCIWATELYADLTALGTFCTQDLQSGEEATRYLFFSQETFPAIIYELYQVGRHRGFADFITSKEALMNAVWEQTPTYAIQYNLKVQLGLEPSHLLNWLFESFGYGMLADQDTPQKDKPCPYITWNPDLSGKNYQLLPI